MHQIIRIIFLHLQFFEDDALFLGDIFFPKQRMQDEIGQHVEGEREMLVENFRVVADQLLGGEGVEISADRIDGARDLFRGPVAGAFEEHVLDEVRDAVLLGRFVARSGADPDADRDGADMRHDFGDDADTVR